MVDTKHLTKVGMAWMSVIYVICFGGVALFPQLRPLFMHYALHVDIAPIESVTTVTTFITGLIIWNVVGALAFGLYGVLSNRIPK